MSDTVGTRTPRRTRVRRRWNTFVGTPRNVVLVGLAMIVAQLGYRTWALSGGWFLIDDYGFLSDVQTQDRLTLEWLFKIHNDHLQPLGFLIAWVVGHSTAYNWALSTSITLVLQALASGSALVFLMRLGGRRWAALVPLGFYLFSVVTLPGFMWWCVAVMQVPQQFAAFTAMALHVEYVRTRRVRFVPLTALAIGFGMLCDVKVAFVGLALIFLSLYLSDVRGPVRRVWEALWRQKVAWLTYGALFAGYLALYLTLNPATELAGRQDPDRLGVFEVMLRYTLGPVVAGGPWRWGPMSDTPLVPTAPPEWAVTLTWMLLVLLAVQAFRRRPATSWALVLLMVAVVINVFMVATARGAIFGAFVGREVRYLGDLAPTLTLVVAVLALGLLPTRALPTSQAPLPADAPVPQRPLALGALVATACLVGAVVSSTAYVHNWHSDYPARVYVQNVVRQSEERPLHVVDVTVPESVLPRDEIVQDYTRPSQLFRPLGARVAASLEGNDLDYLDDEGMAYPATVLPRVQVGAGPAGDCGYQVTRAGVTIPFFPVEGTEALPDSWWASIAYLASADGVVSLEVGDLETDLSVQRGLHTYVFYGSGATPQAELTAVGDVVMCLDTFRIGDLAPLKEQ